MFIPIKHNQTHNTKYGLFLLTTAVILLGMVLLLSVTRSSIVPNTTVASLNQLNLPLAFSPNVGQTDESAQFVAHDMGGTLFFTANSVVLSLPDTTTPFEMQFEGANSAPVINSQQQLQGKVNYILGNDPSQWHTDLPTYEGITYKNLYPGISLHYDGVNGRLKGTYTVAPGANPNLIRWQHLNANKIIINKMGSLVVTGADANIILTEQTPIAWQEINGQTQPVTAAYNIGNNGTISFNLGEYNASYPLIIDPTLVYSTTLGGTGFEHTDDIALDANGNVYITGLTSSTDFPTQNPYQENQPKSDAFVAKINSDGTELVYSTYIGGDQDDEGTGIAVNSNGEAYITGATDSTNFPTVNPVQANLDGLDDAYILALNAAGNDLVYSTFLGGSGVDDAEAIALDTSGNAYVTGMTTSHNFPTKDAYDDSFSGISDAFITKINSGGTEWVYSTYLGGSQIDGGEDIGVDDTGVYVLGNTFSTNFPVQNAYQESNQGTYDIFVTKFNAAGDGLLYSTYLGGSNVDYGYGLAVLNGQAYLTGNTESTDFPTAVPIQAAHAGGTSDAIVATLGATGDTLIFSTYLGGGGDDKGYGLAVSAAADMVATGYTYSSDFPTETPLQANMSGASDAYVTKLNPDGLIYSTFLGGSSNDTGYAVALDSENNAYVAGVTGSSDFPSGNALNSVSEAETDVFVVKINDEGDDVIPPPPGSNLAGSTKTASQSHLWPGAELEFTIRLHNSGADDAIVDVEDPLPEALAYVADSASDNGVYAAGTHTVSWVGIAVPAGEDVVLTFSVTTSVEALDVVVNTAVITPDDDDSIERSAVVLLVPDPIPDDITPPVVEDVTIDEQDVLTSRDVVLHITATDNDAVEKMYVMEWQLVSKPFPHWQVVQKTDWIPYEAEKAWQLGEQSGTHFVAVWVADAAGNISPMTMHSIDSASLLLPDTPVDVYNAVPYLVYYEEDTEVTATLTPTTGDADLYVWYPGNHSTPDQKSVEEGTAVDEVSFTAPESGLYLILVYGYETATYNLTITPVGGNTIVTMPLGTTNSTMSATATKTDILVTEPILTQTGVDPLGLATTPEKPLVDHVVFLPVVFNMP